MNKRTKRAISSRRAILQLERLEDRTLLSSVPNTPIPRFDDFMTPHVRNITRENLPFFHWDDSGQSSGCSVRDYVYAWAEQGQTPAVWQTDVVNNIPGLGAWVSLPIGRDGRFYIEVVANSFDSIISGVGRYDFIIDTTPPGIPTIDLQNNYDSGQSNNDNITNRTNVTLQFHSNGDVNLYRYEIGSLPSSSSATTQSGAVNLNLAPNQTHRVYVEALDLIGNRSHTGYIDIQVDQLSPSAPNLTSPGDGYLTTRQPTLKWSPDSSNWKYQVILTHESGRTILSPLLISPSWQPPALDLGSWQWRVKAWDVAGNEGTFGQARQFTMFVNRPPVANAGQDLSVNEGDTVTLNGSFSDPDIALGDSHTFRWDVHSTNGQNVPTGTDKNFSFTPNDNGQYVVTFTVTDQSGATASDELNVFVNNVAPAVNAGSDQIVTEPGAVRLTGRFTDPGKNDSHTQSWVITKEDGTVVETNNSQGIDFSPTENGIFIATYSVTDDDGAKADDTLIVNVDLRSTIEGYIVTKDWRGTPLSYGGPDCGLLFCSNVLRGVEIRNTKTGEKDFIFLNEGSELGNLREGLFRFENLPPGTYTLRSFSYHGEGLVNEDKRFIGFSTEISVLGNDPAPIYLTLQASTGNSLLGELVIEGRDILHYAVLLGGISGAVTKLVTNGLAAAVAEFVKPTIVGAIDDLLQSLDAPIGNLENTLLGSLFTVYWQTQQTWNPITGKSEIVVEQTRVEWTGPDGFFRTKSSSSDDKLIWRAHSPVSLVVVDPNGRRFGRDERDPNNVIVYDELPGVYHNSEGTKTLMLTNDAISSEYTLLVFGTGDGSYSMDVEAIRGYESPTLEVPSRLVVAGQVDEYRLRLPNFPGDQDPEIGDGIIMGTLWLDRNDDGVRDVDEPALEGQKVFLDENGNAILDHGEEYTLSDSDGHYQFRGVFPGAHTIAQVIQTGWEQTYPTSKNVYQVNLEFGGRVEELDFGSIPRIVLAEVDAAGTLMLNMGPRAESRLGSNTLDEDEVFTLTHIGSAFDGSETILVSAFGEEQEYHGVHRIIADGGRGNDVITIGSGVTATATLVGGSGNDKLVYNGKGSVNSQADTGNDTLIGGSGNDILTGGDGDDILNGHTGKDVIDGGAGMDLIEVDLISKDMSNVSQLIGGLNQDTISVKGSEFDDLLKIYQESADTIRVEQHDLTTDELLAVYIYSTVADIERLVVDGFSGNDHLVVAPDVQRNIILKGGDGNDTLEGGAGQDILEGAGGDDVLIGNDNDDVLRGGEGHDNLNGNRGNDALYGDRGNDTLTGGSDRDILYGGEGNDLFTPSSDIFGDVMYGENGDDTLRGGDGVEILNGGAGNDNLSGGGLLDILFGGQGNDVLDGDAGPDFLFGNEGSDLLRAGAGQNFDVEWTFQYNQLLAEEQRVTNEINALESKRFSEELTPEETVRLQQLSNTRSAINLTQISLDPNQTILVNTLDGGEGNDTLQGSSMPDMLSGGSGNDTFYHVPGDGTLTATLIRDTIQGGTGEDTFFIDGTPEDDNISLEVNQDASGNFPVRVHINGTWRGTLNKTTQKGKDICDVTNG